MNKNKIELVKAYINKNFVKKDLEFDGDNSNYGEKFNDGSKEGIARTLYELSGIIEDFCPEHYCEENWLMMINNLKGK